MIEPNANRESQQEWAGLAFDAPNQFVPADRWGDAAKNTGYSGTAYIPGYAPQPCPSCGYCPHCGRGRNWWPSYPWNPQTYPYWYADYHPATWQTTNISDQIQYQPNQVLC